MVDRCTVQCHGHIHFLFKLLSWTNSPSLHLWNIFADWRWTNLTKTKVYNLKNKLQNFVSNNSEKNACFYASILLEFVNINFVKKNINILIRAMLKMWNWFENVNFEWNILCKCSSIEIVDIGLTLRRMLLFYHILIWSTVWNIHKLSCINDESLHYSNVNF